MQNPKISVIIPCFNHAKYIVESMNSVMNQTFNDFECIIVNDGSTDNSEEVILNWISKDKRFKYLYQDNYGLSKARNTGISFSSAKYILPLDSDDKISSHYLEACINVLEKQDEVKIVYGEAYFFGKKTKKWNLKKYNFEELLYKNMIYCTGLFRKEDWKLVGGYDENLKEGLEDWEFWINILKNGGKVVKLDNCFFYYRVKDNSMITETILNHSYGYNSRVYIFYKHIELYRKTNFYDMYFENYEMKKIITNLHYHLSFNRILKLIPKKLYWIGRKLFNKIIKKF
jgi:glycosyltransferase involved in cell wall biosynthesis|tara:strand:- start:109 stop:966 length:858 start_codon:yes stop_codon:yes gene_type:complete